MNIDKEFKFYYKDIVNMSGEGLIKASINNEDCPVDQALEALIEEIGHNFIDFYNEEYEIGIYVGNMTYFTYDIMIDYNCYKTPDELIDAIQEWLHKNTVVIKIEDTVFA
jgi:hypothetical protein